MKLILSPVGEEGTTDDTDFHRFSAEFFQILSAEIASISVLSAHA
jgi:hypothetical protein